MNWKNIHSFPIHRSLQLGFGFWSERERPETSLLHQFSLSLSLSFDFQPIEFIAFPLRCLPAEGPFWRSSSLGIAGEKSMFFSFSFPILFVGLMGFLFNTRRIDPDRYFLNLGNFLLWVLKFPGLWSGRDSNGVSRLKILCAWILDCLMLWGFFFFFLGFFFLASF